MERAGVMYVEVCITEESIEKVLERRRSQIRVRSGPAAVCRAQGSVRKRQSTPMER